MFTADNIVTITPSAYHRVDLSRFDAVTMWSPEFGYTTINAPRAAFFNSKGGMTVQGPRPALTVKSESSQSAIVTVFHDGVAVSDWQGIDPEFIVLIF